MYQAIIQRVLQVLIVLVLATPAASAGVVVHDQDEYEKAVKHAKPGDTVLLAPAAASFDQYDNFEQRGEDFIAEVGKLTGADG